MGIAVRRLAGPEMGAHLGDLARLRIAVFAEYPYLYDGDEAYETRYLDEFAAERGSVLVAAFDGERVIGAATASPMAGQKETFRKPFEDRGYDTGSMFYFGESVLLREYRGRGLGHAFFDHREAAAREAGARYATFAAVIRPEDHPLRPTGYRPLDGFWRKRGYEEQVGLTTSLSWKEHNERYETVKKMQYWMRQLD